MYTLSRKFPLFSHFIYRQGINGSYCFCHFNSVHCCRCNATGVTSALSAGVDSFYIGSEFFWFPHDPDRRRCTAFYSFQQCIRPVKTGKFFSKSMDSGRLHENEKLDDLYATPQITVAGIAMPHPVISILPCAFSPFSITQSSILIIGCFPFPFSYISALCSDKYTMPNQNCICLFFNSIFLPVLW